MTALGAWLLAFAFTQAVEVPVYLKGAKASLATAALASTLTHPIVWFVFPWLWPLAWGYWPMVAAMESFAVAAEALWLKARGVPRAWLWALGANGLSVGLGLLSRLWLGVP